MRFYECVLRPKLKNHNAIIAIAIAKGLPMLEPGWKSRPRLIALAKSSIPTKPIIKPAKMNGRLLPSLD